MTNYMKLARVSAVVLVLGLASGCATTQQIEAMRADVDKAMQDAAAAQAAANDARAAAASAQGTADQALSAARACTDKCNAVEERMRRMSEQRMTK